MRNLNPQKGKRILLSQRHPILYFIAVWLRRLQRYIQYFLDSKNYASEKSEMPLKFRIKKHQSILLRKLGESDMQLQINKVTNLRIACSRLNGILIKPGETFSFCKLVGLPTKRKGYLEGMEISFGVARPGTGGGICQIANMLHWLVIHSPLSVTERYHHSFDPFPDEGRVLPFGSGATVFFNYLDFQFTNHTKYTFQVNLWLSEKCLEGELRVNEETEYSYHVFEKNHRFLKKEDQYFRQNEIWREMIDKASGNKIKEELITKNFARVKYIPENFEKE